jgi:predicted RNA-binding Zn ribbon-like protein
MPVPELVGFVNDWGTLPRAVGKRPPSDDRVRTALADELHAIFMAPAAGERAALVTALLDRTRVRPALTEHDGALAEEWTVDDPAQADRAAAALALRHHLAEHPGRLGVCSDDQCADVYVDASPAGRRRFCCLTCQNRARAAAFRKRAKTVPHTRRN